MRFLGFPAVGNQAFVDRLASGSRGPVLNDTHVDEAELADPGPAEVRFTVRRPGQCPAVLRRIVLDWRSVPTASSCGQPYARYRADESSDGREADYPVETLELRAEIEPGWRIREPLPGHTSHEAPERHSGQTEEQREHASAPYELDRPNHKSHRRCPQRVVV